MTLLDANRSLTASLCALAASLALAGAIVWQPGLLPAGIGLALLAAVALLNPVVPLVAALLLAPVDINFVLGGGGGGSPNTVSVLVFILVSGALLRIALLGQLRVRPLVILAVLGGVAIFMLTVPVMAVEASAGFALTAQLLTPVAAYLVARDADLGGDYVGSMNAGRRAVVWSVVLAFSLTAVIIVLGRTTESFSGENVNRFTGSLGSGSFAFFLLPPLILNIAALSVRSTRVRWISLGILAIALFATLTRSALLAAALAVVYFSLLSGTRGRGPAVLLLCVALGGIFVAVSPDALNRFRPEGGISSNVVEGTLAGREDLWSFIWRTDVAPSPLVGSGLGATAPIFANQTSFRTGAGAVHNDYLDIWAQGGALALAAYVLFLFAVLFGSVKAVLRSRRIRPPSEWSTILTRAIPPLLLAFLVVSFFDNAAANFVHLGVPIFVMAGFARRGQRAWA